MQTLTIAINNNNALKTLHELEDKQLISIVHSDELDVPALPGKSLSLSEFSNWVNQAEKAPTVTHEEAKLIWASKRNQLQQLIS